MSKEELLLERRLLELSSISYDSGIVMFSDFLNLHELNILHTLPKNELDTLYTTFGGYPQAERQMVAFYHDALCFVQEDFPFSIIKIISLDKKHRKQMTHRDYLGAILNLGLDRSKIGDIIVYELEAYVFVTSNLADFIIENLTRVGNTIVEAKVIATESFSYTPNFHEIVGSVASIRIDNILSLALSTSRGQVGSFIKNGKVFLNGKLVTSNCSQVSDGDIISVRGVGKLRYEGVKSKTKKDRYFITIHKYI